MKVKIALIDSEHRLLTKTELALMGRHDPIREILQQIREELVPGQTAYLEIEGFEKSPMTFEISQFG